MTKSHLGATRMAVAVAGAAGWALFAYMTWASLTIGPRVATGGVFQVDWNVYWVGARDLIDRELYFVSLDGAGLPLSATEFKLPPLSAAWALPLMGFPVDTGGIAWQVLAAASVALAAAIALDVIGVPRPWLWAGVLLGPLSLTLFYLEGLHVGTNNYLVLALVAGAVWAYLRGVGRGWDRAAGLLIGLAIATKLWPVTLLVVVARERRWRVMRWALGTSVVQGVVLFGWLGFDSISAFAAAMRTEIPPSGYLIGPTAIPGLREIWNAGLGAVLAIVLLIIPLRGAPALGLAIVAGLAPIPNLWIHYALTIAFAVALLISPLVSLRAARSAQAA